MSSTALQTSGSGGLASERAFVPRTDIFETADRIVVVAEMPGVAENNLNVTITKNILTIEGRIEPDKPAGYEIDREEYRVGNYRRVFAISTDINRDAVNATMKDGILHLELPKSESVQPKVITVKAG